MKVRLIWKIIHLLPTTSKEYKEIVNSHDESAEEENTPKLFSDEQSQKDIEKWMKKKI